MTRAHTVRRVLLAFAIGVAIAVPAVPAAAGGGGCRGDATEGRATTVDMAKACMTPTVVHVEPGTTVTWTNRDPILHNLYGTNWAYGDLQPGASISRTFDDVGTFPYACTLHPGMLGAVVVGDAGTDLAAVAPVAAVTPDGVDDGEGGGAPLVIGLVGVALAAGAFFAGTRVARSA